MKCSGASTCVPEWTPKSSRVKFAASPAAIDAARSIRTTGSSRRRGTRYGGL
jgi:hypothetical protein